MPFQKIEAEKLSRAIERQIELLILRGVLRPGERLPAERELADKLGVSRPSLRDAIADLQEKGLLTAKPGAGIYVADVLGSAFSPALVTLFSSYSDAVHDYLSFRRDMEGLAAERAARLGSDTDLKVIDTIFRKMETAHHRRSPEEEAALDAAFHLAIIEASHNIIMLHMMRSMYDLLRQGVFYNREKMFAQRTERADLLDQHRRINVALQKRDPVAARRAVEDHLSYVQTVLAEWQRSAEHERVAQQRYDHEQSRA